MNRCVQIRVVNIADTGELQEESVSAAYPIGDKQADLSFADGQITVTLVDRHVSGDSIEA